VRRKSYLRWGSRIGDRNDPETTENWYGVVLHSQKHSVIMRFQLAGGRLTETLMWPPQPWFANSKLLNLLLAPPPKMATLSRKATGGV